MSNLYTFRLSTDKKLSGSFINTIVDTARESWNMPSDRHAHGTRNQVASHTFDAHVTTRGTTIVITQDKLEIVKGSPEPQVGEKFTIKRIEFTVESVRISKQPSTPKTGNVAVDKSMELAYLKFYMDMLTQATRVMNQAL